MARILVLDTIKHPSNSGTANIVLSSDETTTMPTVNINGGQIDSTTLGAASPSSVAATTLSTSGNATVGGTLGVTGNTTVGGTVIGSLDVSGDTLTTSTAQKDAIVDGSTAISRSGNNLTFAGDVVATSNSSAATASIGSSSPNASAILDLTSTTKAFLLPRMTGTQMNAISSPTNGMMIFNTSESEGDGALFVYMGSTWREMTP